MGRIQSCVACGHNGFGGEREGGELTQISSQHSLSEYLPFLIRNPARPDHLFFPGGIHTIQQHAPLESAVTNVAVLVRFIPIVVDQPIPLLFAGQRVKGLCYHHCAKIKMIARECWSHAEKR